MIEGIQRSLAVTIWCLIALCCEILSPEDRLGATLAKCNEYHDWGVPYCWVVDPVKQTAWEYHKGREPVRVSGSLHAGELVVTLAELFAGDWESLGNHRDAFRTGRCAA